MPGLLERVLYKFFPQNYRAFKRWRYPVIFDELRKEPLRRDFGFGRGMPIDRYYIEQFLQAHISDIKGKALEISDDFYLRKFGHDITSYGVLHVESGHEKTTIVGDLSEPETLPSEVIDCFVCTQTFNFIMDVDKAAMGAAQLLSPGGVLLATVAGVCQISRYDMDRWGDYWRFTPLSAKKLFQKYFKSVEIYTYGNVGMAKAFLDGLTIEDINDTQLISHRDEDYPITIAIKAIK